MNRMLAERPLPQDPSKSGRKRAPARSVTVNLAESPLGWLSSRGLVSARQFEAGEMLRRDWEQAGLAPNVTMSWDGAPRSKTARGPETGHPTVRQTAARRRVDAAMKDVGAGLNDLLWRTVCAGEGMREAETALGWPARAGRIVLCIALDRLADHYRLS